MKNFFEKFRKGDFKLEILSEDKIIFRSRKEGVQGFLEFIKRQKSPPRNLIIFDKKVGNAVALLCVFLRAKEVYGVVGSKSAEKTFKKFKTKFHFLKTIPYILNKRKTDVCPLEKLSFSKTPKKFLNSLKVKSYY